MTTPLYQTDSYLREFEARVVEINKDDNSVALDQTAFYPGGGGQPCDTGMIMVGGDTLNVTKVKRQGDLIFHTHDGEPPEVGTAVKGVINWDNRYKLMRTHTALHILCGVIWRDYKASVTGGNMEPLKGRMDFEFETMRQELVKEIEEKVNVEVANARDVMVKILPREEAFKIPDLIRTRINLLPEAITEVRTVEIAGLDLQADGGTHVANTGEVGIVKVVDYKSKGRINKRIHIELE
ncbi:MAG: alanyl-tRNA editing protein [Candidatus Zixiibacteriota bacterium]|nr:MAG: alanyl-tRNA editing protein [candidate division Zixibacteria bacterium]